MDKKKWISGALGAVSSLLGAMAVPVYLLIASNIIDYITGAAAAPKRGATVDSSKGIAGIKKKVNMWWLVIVGGMVDIMIDYAGGMFGFSISFKFLVASAVAVWLVINEWLSILENLNDAGVALPPFLLPLIKNLKTQVENTVETEEESEE